MAGKRIPQDNTPVVSPQDFQERKAKQDIENRRLANVAALGKRIRELEAAEKVYTAEIQELKIRIATLEEENTEMVEKMKTFGADAPLEDPIADEDLELTKEPATARELPKKDAKPTKKDEDDDEEKTDKEDL